MINLRKNKIIFIFIFFLVAGISWAAQNDSVIIKVRVNQKPIIQSITPTNKSKFTEQDIIVISVTATDPDGDALEYQFSVDEVVKQSWSSSSNYQWQTTIGDNRLRNIKVEVRDNISGIDLKNASIYVFRKPIEPPPH